MLILIYTKGMESLPFQVILSFTFTKGIKNHVSTIYARCTIRDLIPEITNGVLKRDLGMGMGMSPWEIITQFYDYPNYLFFFY